MNTIARFTTAAALLVALNTAAAAVEARLATSIDITSMAVTSPSEIEKQFPDISASERNRLLFRIADAHSVRLLARQ